MNKLIRILFFVLIVSLFASCEKNPGEGGNATIIGSVWVKDYNTTFTELIGEYAAMQEDVFIVYGDNVGFDDKTETDYLGNYRFEYLRPGKYSVFVYSKDSTLETVNGEIAIIKEIEITDASQELSVPQITIFN